MSPTENDLRAALHDGEGDGLDPDAVLAAGRASAARRRGRIAGVTGAVVGVLAVATTAGILLARDGSPTTSAQRDDVGAGTSGGGRSSAVAALPTAAAEKTAPLRTSPHSSGGSGAATCPATFPGAAPSGGTGALFTAPVASVTVCAYGSSGSADGVVPSSTTLAGAQARALATSLNGASPVAQQGVCPMYRVADDHRLAFVAVSTIGAVLPTVSTTLGNPTCSVRVTNGSVTRFNWQPTATLKATLFALQPKPR